MLPGPVAAALQDRTASIAGALNHARHYANAGAGSGYALIVIASATLALLIFLSRLHDASSTSRGPFQLPLAGEKQGVRRFSFLTRLAYYFDCSSLYGDVWHRFSKNGLAVLVPTLGTRKEIFLPHASLRWVVSQPARVLGMWDAFGEMFQLGHSLGDDKYMIDTWAHLLARQVLTQELDDHLMAIHEELQVAIDTHLGTDTENWKTLNLLDTVRMIINQAGSRFTVGAPLCRNQTYLRTIMNTIDSIVSNASATGFFPAWLRPILGRIICFPTSLRIRHLSTFYKPIFKERIQALDQDMSEQPVDLLQKMLRFARKNRPEELATEQMTRRMCLANLAFVYLASFTTTNIITNIMASDAEHDTIAVLRAEAESFLASHPDPSELWTRRNTTQMVRADSVMRESLRLNTVPTRAIVRKVMADGVVTNTGLALPKGALVSFVSQPMHTDPDRFDDPMRFDPFRFTRLREEDDETRRAKAASEDVGGNWNPHSFLSTSSLLVFGRGKHSCPGRFLMEIQLKMLISYLLCNYDIKFPGDYKGERPANHWVLEFIFPAKGAKFQVKRRKKSTTSE